MVEQAKQYPKFLAFLQLLYPDLYQALAPFSHSSEIVEANLICSNNLHSFEAAIYSEGDTSTGELFKMHFGKNSISPYAWDWRWVFAMKLNFEQEEFFAMKLKQKVIALPTGKNPLTHYFFDNFHFEMKVIIDEWINNASKHSFEVSTRYSNYLKSIAM